MTHGGEEGGCWVLPVLVGWDEMGHERAFRASQFKCLWVLRLDALLTPGFGH